MWPATANTAERQPFAYRGIIMGIESFTSGIDRRKMLVAAAATVTGVAQAFPNVDAAVTPNAAQSLTAPPGTPALNVSAGIARRLSAIECRN